MVKIISEPKRFKFNIQSTLRIPEEKGVNTFKLLERSDDLNVSALGILEVYHHGYNNGKRELIIDKYVLSK